MIINPENFIDLNDIEIIKKSLENLDYFSCLYQRYESVLLRYIRRLTGVGSEEAQDILQESFIKVWRNLHEFEQEMTFSVWLYRIVHNEAVSFIRKDRSYGKNKRIDAISLEDIIQDDFEPDNEERFVLIQKTLNLLPLKYRDVLILRFFEKKSYEEISDILKIPEGTVGIRINRAKRKFKDLSQFKSDV